MLRKILTFGNKLSIYDNRKISASTLKVLFLFYLPITI